MCLLPVQDVLVYEDTHAGGPLRGLMDVKAGLTNNEMSPVTRSLFKRDQEAIVVVDDEWDPENAITTSVDLFKYEVADTDETCTGTVRRQGTPRP